MKTLISNLLSLCFKRHFYVALSLASILSLSAQAQEKKIDALLPVRGLSIGAPAPAPEDVDGFLRFVEEELAPAHFNLLILIVDWNYAYETHPELRSENPLTKADARRIAAVCRKHGIEIAPSIELLGHQSWEKVTGNLLRAYPEFDETPHLKTEDFSGFDWFNPDFFYCKSYCPLHPGVHKVVFDAVDELTDAFEATLFHAGMDEVTIIGDAHCPRCGGRDKAELFAGEVTTIYNHLAQQGKKMMIWGDRLIDGKATGFHPSQSSMNNTHRAIDLIPKEVFICDWHYEQANQSPVYFAMKGLDVAICPWKNVNVAMQELEDMLRFRERATTVLKPRFRGLITTVWSGNKPFLKGYYETGKTSSRSKEEAVTVKKLMEEYKKLNQ